MTPDENDIIFNTYSIDYMPLVEWVARFFGYGDDPLGGPTVYDFIAKIISLWETYSVIALFLSLLFFAAFIYARIRLGQVLEEEDALIRMEEMRWADAHSNTGVRNTRWDDIKQHIATENPNDWKQAIIEADIMLGEVLDASGYIGEGIGDMLKSARSQPFPSIQDAWDAHLVRNKVAHSGPDFVLTKRLAQETIIQYERVFREFGAV